MKPTQADSEIEEEHLLNFVVNSLEEELTIDLGENIEVTSEKLYEVLAGASAGGTSINHVCETTDDSPHANTVRGHLTDQFDLDTVEAVGDTLLQRDALETLPDRPVEVVADVLERIQDIDTGIRAQQCDEVVVTVFDLAKPLVERVSTVEDQNN